MEDQRNGNRGAERRGIQSIEVGGALLQALVRHGAPMMLKDLARAAGMPPAKAHPYLVSFGKLGLIEQDPLTGRYGLGPFSLQMGLTALHGLDPLRAATIEAARLADEIELNVAIAVWGNHGPTIVRIEESSKQIHVNMRPGTVMTPLLLSATGRVFATFLPARITQPILEKELVQFAATPQAALRLSRRHVEDIVAEVRRVDCALLDATFFRDGELQGRAMQEVPHPFVEETMRLFENQPASEKKKVTFIHFNHTNPLLWDEKARQEVRGQGFTVTEEGMRVGM